MYMVLALYSWIPKRSYRFFPLKAYRLGIFSLFNRNAVPGFINSFYYSPCHVTTSWRRNNNAIVARRCNNDVTSSTCGTVCRFMAPAWKCIFCKELLCFSLCPTPVVELCTKYCLPLLGLPNDSFSWDMIFVLCGFESVFVGKMAIFKLICLEFPTIICRVPYLPT